MGLEGANGGHQHGGPGFQVVVAGLDVHEFFEAQVRTEARLGDNVVGVAQSQAVRQDGAAAVSYVSKGARVHDYGLAFGGLHEIGLYGEAEEGHHRAYSAHVQRRDGLVHRVETHDHAAQTGAQVFQAAG